MRFPMTFGVLAGGIVAVLLFGCAVGAAPTGADSPELSWDELAAMCESAKADFRPITQADLKPLLAELKDATARLEAWLKVAGPHAAWWRNYLEVEKLQQQLQGPALPDQAVLGKIYRHYSFGPEGDRMYPKRYEGLGLVWFIDVQRALLHYLEAAQAVDNPETKSNYETQLRQLAGLMKAYREKPTPPRAWAIGKTVQWLEGHRQAPQLAAAVRQRFSRPNLVAEISSEAVNAGMAEAIDECTPIQDCILGTTICGTGHTVGETRAVLADADGCGVIDTQLFTKTSTSTVGYHGPVTIYSSGLTRIGGVKRLWVNQNGVFEHPACSKAVTCTSIDDIEARRRIVERIAWKKAMQQIGTAEWIASRHAESRANRRIDEQAAKNVAEANQKFQDKFRRPLDEHKLFPELFHVGSNPEAVRLKTMLCGASLLAAVQPPPEAVKADLVLRVHESMINNFAQDALGGMTIHEENFKREATKLFGELPKKMKTPEDQAPWEITFAQDMPIYVHFDKDRFSITIRGEEYRSGDKSISTMAVTANYTIHATDAGFEAVRDEKLVVVPEKYAVRSGVPRSVFVNRFESIFDKKIVGEGFTLKGRWQKAGKFVPLQFASRDGWLVLAWKRVALPAPAPEEKTPPARTASLAKH